MRGMGGQAMKGRDSYINDVTHRREYDEVVGMTVAVRFKGVVVYEVTPIDATLLHQPLDHTHFPPKFPVQSGHERPTAKWSVGMDQCASEMCESSGMRLHQRCSHVMGVVTCGCGLLPLGLLLL